MEGILVLGVAVAAAVLFSAIFAAAVRPARPAMTMSYAGLLVVAGGFVGLLAPAGYALMAAGLMLGAVALWRDADDRKGAVSRPMTEPDDRSR